MWGDTADSLSAVERIEGEITRVRNRGDGTLSASDFWQSSQICSPDSLVASVGECTLLHPPSLSRFETVYTSAPGIRARLSRGFGLSDTFIYEEGPSAPTLLNDHHSLSVFISPADTSAVRSTFVLVRMNMKKDHRDLSATNAYQQSTK